ncbi:MAG: esterase/lipase family protein [Myxococcales bacterium]
MASIRDFPPSERPPGQLVARELAAAAGAALLFPLGLGKRRPRPTARAAGQRTVVLVHGYLANRSSLWPLRAYLWACGVRQIRSFDYGPLLRGGRGIEAAAVGLRDFLRTEVRGGRIDLVCHSLGGLVARLYLQELKGARRVDRCITLGTPHQGTYNAYWLTSRVARELRPDSPLLARLESGRAAAASVRFASVVAGSDPIVVPRVFGTASGTHEELVYLPHMGHLGLLFSPAAFRAVEERLRRS